MSRRENFRGSVYDDDGSKPEVAAPRELIRELWKKCVYISNGEHYSEYTIFGCIVVDDTLDSKIFDVAAIRGTKRYVELVNEWRKNHLIKDPSDLWDAFIKVLQDRGVELEAYRFDQAEEVILSGQKRYLSIQARISSIFEFSKSSRKKTQLFIMVLKMTDS